MEKFTTPQFRLLSDKQIEELHLAALQVLERTGVDVGCQEALNLLGEGGADISNPKRVKIPPYLVEQALKTVPKSFTLYTREGEPAMTLNGMNSRGSHFGAISDNQDYLDPYTRQRRPCYAEDIADVARLVDALPNMEWTYIIGSLLTVPAVLAEKVAFLQVVLNSSKPIDFAFTTTSNVHAVCEVCSIIAGGEDRLRSKPFCIATNDTTSPLVLGKDSLERDFLCAEKGIPLQLGSGPMAGATAPSTLPGVITIGTAEFLAHLVVVQLKKPGLPIVYGSTPSIMDMKTAIYSYGAPELSLLIAAQTEMSHYYKLPMFGTAGCTDAHIIGVQAGAEIAYQVLMSVLSGADFVHDAGITYHSMMVSPEVITLTDEIISMTKVIMDGIKINDETLPLELIDRVGPGGEYLSKRHTFNHFRERWVPTIFDRSVVKDQGVKNCEEMLNEKTLKILKTYKPKPLSEDLVKELKKIEGSWFKQVGLKHACLKRE